MAEHVDTSEMTSPPDSADIGADERESPNTMHTKDDSAVDQTSGVTDEEIAEVDDQPRLKLRKRLTGPAAAIIICAVAVVALGTVAAVFGHRWYSDRETHSNEALFVQAARQGVINLTTVRYTSVDADIKRILDSSTGGFHDDFQRRSQPFAEVVKQAKTTSEGTITAAALQTHDQNEAKVLVTVSLKMSNAGAPEQQPRSWRMVIDVQRTGDTAKISNVQFAT